MTILAPISPPATIGMLGGGQLGRMFTQAAHSLGYRVSVFEPDREAPVGKIADDWFMGQWNDREQLEQFARKCDVVTLEWENVPSASLEIIAGICPVHPSANVLRIAQDRQVEKSTLSQAGLPVTPFCSVDSLADLRRAGELLGFPLILKTARSGYDGKGQIRIENPQKMEHAYESLGQVPAVAEKWISFRRELSVLIAQNAGLETAIYPLMENHHAHHILDLTLFPAEISPRQQQKGVEIAIRVARCVGLIGILCVELFELESGELLINEIAPRPHNSGHATIEAAVTSQFEQHVRAVCGMPLGDTSSRTCAVMANLLGHLWDGGSPDVPAVLAMRDVHLHLYGKTEPRHGRKMGHLTALASSLADARTIAVEARNRFAGNDSAGRPSVPTTGNDSH